MTSRSELVAIYARVSTRDQHPENQLLELRRFAELQRWTVQGEYIDHGESGSKVFDNPKSAHSQVRELARRGVHCPFGVVLVWKFDRFARSVIALHNALFEFDRAGIRFVSVQEQVDTKSVHGKFVFAVLAGAAEMETGMLRERIFAGLARARAQGKKFGRPRRMSLARVEAATRLREQGASWREIARHFGLPKDVVRESVMRYVLEHPQGSK